MPPRRDKILLSGWRKGISASLLQADKTNANITSFTIIDAPSSNRFNILCETSTERANEKCVCGGDGS